MAVHTFLLPDGGELSSGPGKSIVIQKVVLTQQVNTQEALSFGSVFSSCLEAQLFSTADSLPLTVGDEIEMYRDGEKQGVFYIENLEKAGKGVYKLTALDSLCQLDKDVSGYLASLSRWPYTLQELAGLICAECGLSLKEEAIPNGELPVYAFEGRGITGRMVLSWVGQAAGRFCRANADGQAEFAWYTPRELTLEPGGENWSFRGSFRFEQTVPAIDQVQLRREETDVGTVYPQGLQGGNVYVVEGNPLLTAQNGGSLLGVAQGLYGQLEGIFYTPGQVTIPSYLEIAPGQIITIRDDRGNLHTFFVMGRKRQGGKDILTCTGVQNREQARIAGRQSLQSLSGKVLHLQMDVDGILAENREAKGNLSRLQLDVEGIRTQVSRQQEEAGQISTQLSALQQESGKLTYKITQITENGTGKVTTDTGYRFDKDGLWISKSGEEMENKLDHTGMYVRRSGQLILQANNRGVEAADVTVRNYLTVGQFARLEDYQTNRTACFYIGGTNDGI